MNAHLTFPIKATLSEVQALLFAHFNKGDAVNCPACGQLVKRYERRITSSMALALVMLYHFFMQSEEKWVHIPSFLASHKHLSNRLLGAFHGGDYAKLQHWGLIEKKKETREDGSDRSGYWKITSLGCRFVRGETKVPVFAYIFNDHLYGFSNELTDVVGCMRNRFNYEELMGLKL